MPDLRASLSKSPFKKARRYGMAILDLKGNPIEYDGTRGVFLMDPNTQFVIAVGNMHSESGVLARLLVNGHHRETRLLKPGGTCAFGLPRSVHPEHYRNFGLPPYQVDLKYRFVDQASISGKAEELVKPPDDKMGHRTETLVSDLGQFEVVIGLTEEYDASDCIEAYKTECSYVFKIGLRHTPLASIACDHRQSPSV